ncbi:MAG: DUF2017 family protein [Aquihabitans sp.]
MGLFRDPNWVVRPQGNGRFKVVLRADLRGALSNALDELSDLLDDPDSPVLARLSPPAYLQDPDKDVEYQLLAGEELRTSRRAAIDAVRSMLEQTDVDEDDLWAWLQSLNALRLVLGTLLDISDDDDGGRDVHDDDPAAPIWALYDLATVVQYQVIQAISP